MEFVLLIVGCVGFYFLFGWLFDRLVEWAKRQ